ncbi:MAG: TlpA disulfide reductase family protein, partial [Rhodothermales bacterium]|nr:TlpA disulfide reductase family protein [Rhodothermales bacterium]
SVLRSGGTRQAMPLQATRGQAHRFSHEDESPTVDISGRWAVTFHPNDSTTTPAIGEFTQDGYNVAGTFLTPTGDYRFLAGDVTGRRVRLSMFDGYYAFLFDAEVDSSGVMRGDFWSGTHWHETWEAVRDEDARLPDADALTFIKPGGRDFTFAFPDTTGRLVAFTDSLFLDRVVVASISASWCPNCHDEAAFWAPYYREHRHRGLQIVGLMFEHEESFDEAVEQVKAFAARHAIDYPLLVGGSSDKQGAHRSLPMLNRVMAYPTTLFIDRRGVVRRVHTGFSGPGTGDHYRELTRDFADYVDFLLAEDSA